MGKEVVSQCHPGLVEGRKILEASRKRMAPVWVRIRGRGTSWAEKVALGYEWKQEIDAHISASRGLISQAKLELGLKLTQPGVERLARKRIIRDVVKNGGTKEEGIILAERMIRLTKRMQEREGVSD